MKTITCAFCGLLAAASLSFGQTAVVETTTTTPVELRGTVTTFNPTASEFIVTGANATPMTYRYSKTTTMVDEMGNPVAVEVVRSGAPVTVYYTNANGQMVASKVVVHKAATPVTLAPVVEETTTTTTTTTKDD